MSFSDSNGVQTDDNVLQKLTNTQYSLDPRNPDREVYDYIGSDANDRDFFRYNLARGYLLKSLIIPISPSYRIFCRSFQQDYDKNLFDKGLQLIVFKNYKDVLGCDDEQQEYYSCGSYVVVQKIINTQPWRLIFKSFLENENYNPINKRPTDFYEGYRFISKTYTSGLKGIACKRKSHFLTYYHSITQDSLLRSDDGIDYLLDLENWNNFPVQIVSFSTSETGNNDNLSLEIFMCVKFFCSKKISKINNSEPYYTNADEVSRKPTKNSDQLSHEKLRFIQYRNFLFSFKTNDGTQYGGIKIDCKEQIGHSKFYKITSEDGTPKKIIAFSTLPGNSQGPDSDVPPILSDGKPDPTFNYKVDDMSFDGKGYPLCFYVFDGNESKTTSPTMITPLSKNLSNITLTYAPNIKSNLSISDKLFIGDNLSFYNKVCWSDYLMEKAIKNAFKSASEVAVICGKSLLDTTNQTQKYSHKIYFCRYLLDFSGTEKKLFQVGQDEIGFDSGVQMSDRVFPIQNLSLSQNGEVLLYDDTIYFLAIPPFSSVNQSSNVKAIKTVTFSKPNNLLTTDGITNYKKKKPHLCTPAISSYYGTKFLISNNNKVFIGNALIGTGQIQTNMNIISNDESCLYHYFYTYPSERFVTDYKNSTGVINVARLKEIDADFIVPDSLCCVPYNLSDTLLDSMKIKSFVYASSLGKPPTYVTQNFSNVIVPSESRIYTRYIQILTAEIFDPPFPTDQSKVNPFLSSASVSTEGKIKPRGSACTNFGLSDDKRTLILTTNKEKALMFNWHRSYDQSGKQIPSFAEVVDKDGILTQKFVSISPLQEEKNMLVLADFNPQTSVLINEEDRTTELSGTVNGVYLGTLDISFSSKGLLPFFSINRGNKEFLAFSDANTVFCDGTTPNK